MKGIACLIQRNKSGDIINVQKRNGEPSVLFQEAQIYLGNQEEALKMWSIAYSPSFKASYGEWEPADVKGEGTIVEPSFEKIQAYVAQRNALGSNFSASDLNDIFNNLSDLNDPDVNSRFSDVWARLMDTFYPSGVFDVSYDRLMKSKLYTQQEARELAEDTELQRKVANFLAKMEDFYTSNGVEKLESMFANDMTTFSNEDELDFLSTINQSSEKIGIGKYRRENVNIVRNELAKELSGVTDKDTFLSRLNANPYGSQLGVESKDSPLFAKLYDYFSEVYRVPAYTLVGDTLERAVDTPTIYSDVNTFKGYSETVPVTIAVLDDLLSKSDIVLNTGNESVKELLKSVEGYLAKANIDVVGISDKVFKTDSTELRTYLTTLRDFLLSADQDGGQNIATLNKATSTFLYGGDGLKTAYPYPSVTFSFPNLASVKKNLLTFNKPLNMSAFELYSKHGLVEVSKDDNIYIQVDKSIDMDTLYRVYAGQVIRLGKRGTSARYSPLLAHMLGLTGEITAEDFEEKAQNLLKESIREDFPAKELNRLKNRLKRESPIQISEEYERFLIEKDIYTHAFDKDKTATRNSILPVDGLYGDAYVVAALSNIGVNEVYSSLYSKMLHYNGNFDYLTVQFKTDFMAYVLQHKVENTVKYNRALKHFTFNKEGVRLANSDINTLVEITHFLDDKVSIERELLNYAIIANDVGMGALAEKFFDLKEPINDGKEVEITDALVFNYGKILSPIIKKVSGNFIGDSVLVSDRDNALGYINTDRGIMKKIGSTGTYIVYKKLSGEIDAHHLNLNLVSPTLTPTEVAKVASKFGPIKTNLGGVKNHAYDKLSKAEKDKLDNTLDSCQ